MGRTYEVQLVCEDKDALCHTLEALGYDGYVDASFDQLDHDEGQSEQLIEEILADESRLPVSLYFSQATERDRLLEQIKATGLKVDIKLNDFDDLIWQQAWEEAESSFSTECFAVTIDGIEPEARKFSILMDAQGAFGSGQHATTKAILRLFEQESDGEGACLDVGTGTGILAVAAERLGYQPILATDIEEQAIQAAIHNRQLNQCSFDVLLGSLPKDSAGKYRMVLSNILPPVLNHLLPDFVNALEPGGKIILAGFNEANCQQILDELAPLGLSLRSQVDERGWLAYCLERS